VGLLVRKLPSIVLVIVPECCFSSRDHHQKCCASPELPTPRWEITSTIASATCWGGVSRILKWSRRANMSTMRGILLNPIHFVLGR